MPSELREHIFGANQDTLKLHPSLNEENKVAKIASEEEATDLQKHLVKDHYFDPELMQDENAFNMTDLQALHMEDHQSGMRMTHNPEVLIVASKE
jgi:hypothetical protein